MATSIVILSWNIQILGDAKISRSLCPNILSAIIVQSGADIVAIQEPVFSYVGAVSSELIAALKVLKQDDWIGTYMQALPSGGDRDAYLFLWRGDKYAQQVIGGAPVQGTFQGDWPNNISPRNGRRPGYVGLTLADGSHPFIVAAYHAPTQAKAMSGSAPATGLAAIATEATQLTTYTDGGAKAYEARFLCADFNLDITDAYNQATWYQPAMNATATTNATVARTVLIAQGDVPDPPPTNSAAYITKNLDNILLGPAASFTGATCLNTIDVVADKGIASVIEAFFFTNGVKTWWNPRNVFTRFDFVRSYVSDHLPVIATLTLVP